MNTIKELGNLNGRKALITGATGELGKIIADTLGELGADLILIDKPGSDFETLKSELIKRWGVKIESYFCDLEIPDERSNLIFHLVDNNKCLNILINNAAFVGTSDLEGWNVSFGKQTIDTWRRVLEVNLLAAFDLCQGLMPLIKKAEGGNIINIASIHGVYGPDWSLYENTEMNNAAAYAASKGGLIQLTRWLATTVSPDIRVNCISPGGIFRKQNTLFVERYEARTPLKRMAVENDLKGAIAYLSSDLAKYVTGQNLLIDGGWGVW